MLQSHLERETKEQTNIPLLEIRHLKKYFPITTTLGKTKGFVKSVDGVDFDLYENQTLGLVGESGCGKSTTGRTILRLIEPTDGEAIYQGKNIFQLKGKALKQIRKEFQIVFQDPHSSLDPKMRIGDAVMEPMKIHHIGTKKDRMDRAMELLLKVGIREDQFYRYPHEFSGGQRQRIGLARALAVNPKLVVCDEPVSALDVSIQSQVINLLEEIQEQFQLTYLFISHDLSVVRHMADQICVMYLGQIVERAPTDELFTHPLHPYTQALLSAIPLPNPKLKKERIIIKGEVPSPIDPPSGCVFHTRCPYATALCKTERPQARELAPGHIVSCHLAES